VFAERFKAARTSLGLSQAKAAEALGYSRSQLIEWEKNGVIPSGAAITKIAEYFRVTTGWLLGLTDSRDEEAREENLSPDERLILALDRLREATRAVEEALHSVRQIGNR